MLGNAIALIAIAAMFGLEAYKVKDRLPRLVLGTIAVLFAIGGALVDPIVKQAPAIGAFLSGVFGQPIAWFILFFALFFVLRPLWAKPIGKSDAMIEYDDGPLRQKIDEEMSEVGRLLKALTDTVNPALKSQSELNTALGKSFDQQKADVEKSLASALAERREFQARMEMWVNDLRRAIRFGFAGIDQGFTAILSRERLLAKAIEIQDVGDELSGPTNGEELTDRDAWLAKYGAWHSDVEAWAQLAETYCDGTIGRVFDTPPQQYKGKWKAHDGLFPDSDAVHDYKTFRIILRNFQVERKRVDQCVQSWAFAAPSRKVRGDYDGEDVETLTMPPPPRESQ